MFRVAHQRYALYFHKKYQAKGHLWQAKFYSCAMSEVYAIMAIRYVECNSWYGARGLGYFSLGVYGNTGELIVLADAREYIDVVFWEQYLLTDDASEFAASLHKNTFAGALFR